MVRGDFGISGHAVPTLSVRVAPPTRPPDHFAGAWRRHDLWLVFARRHYPVHQNDRIIIDLGAQNRDVRLDASREAPQLRIVSIEPFSDTCSRLRSLVEKIGCESG